MDYTTNIAIFRDEFTNPILHDDDEWCTMLWRYYCMFCAIITTFIVESLRSIWSIEFATIILNARTKLQDVNFNIFLGYILIYGGIIVGLVWIAVFIAGLWGSTKTKDATENTNKDPTENTNKDPIENTEGDEPSLPSLPTGAVSTDTAPPPLVSEPKGPRTTIKQLRDIQSLLAELESKVKELESSIAEESLTSSANSTTDDSTSNEETDEHNERIDDREPPTMAQAKANARLWQQTRWLKWSVNVVNNVKKRKEIPIVLSKAMHIHDSTQQNKGY